MNEIALVADANILFSLANESSMTNKIISDYNVKLISPDFALDELSKYEEEIVRKSRMSFTSIIKRLKDKVTFYKTFDLSKDINGLSGKISDEKDLVYLALAKKLGISIWSNDKHFREQSLIKVFSTKDLIEILF